MNPLTVQQWFYKVYSVNDIVLSLIYLQTIWVAVKTVVYVSGLFFIRSVLRRGLNCLVFTFRELSHRESVG